MTQIKIGQRIWRIHDAAWPEWVRRGWVPPDALVLSPRWTRGLWRRADSLEVYHLFRPSDRPVRPAPDAGVPRHGPFGMFRGPGLSVTEVLITVNVIVAGGLAYVWRDGYASHLWSFSARLHDLFFSGWAPVLLIPLFLHASLTHLASNLIVLLAGGAVVEEYYGRARMLFFYLATGLSGALLSLVRVKPVLSVGASGAILGMYGVALIFLLRERRHFPHRHRWKVKRVYLPFFSLMVIPSILNADMWSHLGGFLGGALLALFVPPLADRLPRPGHAAGVGRTTPAAAAAPPAPGRAPGPQPEAGPEPTPGPSPDPGPDPTQPPRQEGTA